MTVVSEAIGISGARKVYSEVGKPSRVAVEDVALSVDTGGIHGLLGPNGAGKTTTLKMLLGLVRPTAGRFVILGRPASSPPVRVAVGFLPEQPYFPSQLTPNDVLRMHGRLAGMRTRDVKAKAGTLLERVGLSGRGDERLEGFSRGMLQRVGLAQALVASPDVLVLDEPASGLDPIGQRDVRNLMLALREEGATILLSSHQLSEIEAVCDRVTILNKGRVAAEGVLAELLSVEGRCSVRVTGLPGEWPERMRGLADDVAVSAGTSVFSVPAEKVREAVDAVCDAGGAIESVVPKKDSLEDYFAKLVEPGRGGEG